jgi:four helix bundle protein
MGWARVGHILRRMTTDSSDVALLAWESRQHQAVTSDPLWRLNCYREALFLADHARDDANSLAGPRSASKARDQLIAAVGSIAANIAEGYGRPTVRDRICFFSYALGSTREAIAWYITMRSVRSNFDVDDRLARLSRLRRMLLALLARLRTNTGRKLDSW